MSGRHASVDTIVRFHDSRRLVELQRCVLSLVSQTYQPVHVHIVTQRFSDHEISAVRQSLDCLSALATGARLSVHNWSNPEPPDARSHLLNYGITFADGRFLAFLDYDDVLYPAAYKLLIKQLVKSGTAVAFASVRVMRLQVFDSFCRVLAKEKAPFAGETLVDLFQSNFAPIHSYMIDRTHLDTSVLQFDCDLAWEEDYEFLLRLCARYRSDFGLLGTEIGDYYFKTDRSNTVPTNLAAAASRTRAYAAVQKTIQDRRARIVLSEEVLNDLGLRADGQPTTVRDVIDLYPRKARSSLSEEVLCVRPIAVRKGIRSLKDDGVYLTIKRVGLWLVRRVPRPDSAISKRNGR